MRMHHFTEFSAGHGYLEAPRYRDGKLWVSDFFAAHVITVDTTDGSIEKIFDVPNSPRGSVSCQTDRCWLFPSTTTNCCIEPSTEP